MDYSLRRSNGENYILVTHRCLCITVKWTLQVCPLVSSLSLQR